MWTRNAETGLGNGPIASAIKSPMGVSGISAMSAVLLPYT